jgi:hypothetical protein
MIARYTRPDMGRIWSDENKFRSWLEVELAAADALAELGVVPEDAARLLREHANFTVARIQEIENEVRHDVIAFTTAVSENIKVAGRPEASRCTPTRKARCDPAHAVDATTRQTRTNAESRMRRPDATTPLSRRANVSPSYRV